MFQVSSERHSISSNQVTLNSEENFGRVSNSYVIIVFSIRTWYIFQEEHKTNWVMTWSLVEKPELLLQVTCPLGIFCLHISHYWLHPLIYYWLLMSAESGQPTRDVFFRPQSIEIDLNSTCISKRPTPWLR